jgi:pyrroline-5-carboxylate reductase
MKISIIGAGNIGTALAEGFSGIVDKQNILLCRRNLAPLEDHRLAGYQVTNSNLEAVKGADMILLAVLPQQINQVLKEIAPQLNSSNAIIVSTVTGISIQNIRNIIGEKAKVARAMPNTALSLRQSMTCIAFDGMNIEEQESIQQLFNQVGTTLIIKEEMMTAATALCACGIAFFMRAIRSASQGGIEMGFHAEEALQLAVQTAKGAALLLEKEHAHPEKEIDRVTSPKGCTIAGLNEMEHNGYSSAMIKGLLTSFHKANELYKN